MNKYYYTSVKFYFSVINVIIFIKISKGNGGHLKKTTGRFFLFTNIPILLNAAKIVHAYTAIGCLTVGHKEARK